LTATLKKKAREEAGSFLNGGGKAGALMRTHDWSKSPLGAPETWPEPLKLVVGLLRDSMFPMFVAWGPELSLLYNDAYAEILGAKHPASLGARFRDVWVEVWPDIAPLVDAAMAGEATFREDLPLIMNRRGYHEQAWFTFSYSRYAAKPARSRGCSAPSPRRRSRCAPATGKPSGSPSNIGCATSPIRSP